MTQVFNRDCMEAMKEFPDKFFELAIVDPPYGIGYSSLVGSKKAVDGWKERDSSEWDSNVPDENYFTELFRVSKNQIIWGGNYFKLSPQRCFIIWDKVQRIDQADCEFAWTSLSGSARIFSYARGNESGFAPKLEAHTKQGANIHPTQKPIALYKWLLKNYANKNRCGGKHTDEYIDLCTVCREPFRILDTHLGSGSSRIAADQMGFDFWGYELDKDYFEASVKRFNQYKAQTVLF